MAPIRGDSGSRRGLVCCTCPPCCADWDPRVHKQSKKGKYIPRSTRDNHRADQKEKDRMLGSLQAHPSNSGVQAQPIQSTSMVQLAVSLQPQPEQTPLPLDNTLWLTSLADELKRLALTPLVDPHRPLVFVNAPSPLTSFAIDIPSDLQRPNCSQFQLTRTSSNQRFLRAENRLAELHQLILSLSLNADHAEEILAEITVLMGRVTCEKHLQWCQQLTGDSAGPFHLNTDMFFFRGAPRSKVYRSVVLSALVMYHIYSAPRRAIAAQLAGMRSILRSLNIAEQDLQYPIPRDPRTTTVYYNLHPITRKYVSCPTCHCLYLWNGEKMGDPQIPTQCTYRTIPRDDHPVCGTDLWKAKHRTGNHVYYVPVRIYVHQPLKFWLGRLLSRPEMEEHIDKANASSPNTNGVMRDIWDSPSIHTVKGPDGLPFVAGAGAEGRLAFSLAVDSFNPEHVKAAHSAISSTGIWLVLLNLPEHLRYLHQNMYVAGVIPGPQKPSLEQLNHYLDLVIDDLVEFYNPGVRLSRTHKYAVGRIYRAVLIPLICDMLAARQVIGQVAAPTAHNFCTVCNIDKDDINILDPSKWPSKDVSQIRKYAKMWKDATSIETRQQYYDASGIRWSPLFRLPYWDPVKFTVIDAMHTLDLGLFQNHCRTIFALNVDLVSGDGSCLATSSRLSNTTSSIPTYNDSFIASYKRCIRLVTENNAPSLEQDLARLLRRVLYVFCVDNNITSGGRDIVIGTRCVLARSIIEWRSSEKYVTPLLPEAMKKADQRRTQPLEGSDTGISESDGESTQGASIEKALIPAIQLLLQPTAENIGKLKTKGKAKIYITLCLLLGIDYSSIDLARRSAKQQLQTLLLDKLKDDDVRQRLTGFLPPDPGSKSQRVVLGRDIMHIVWDDMKKTCTPTWLATAPPNWGTAERGKLSAAQWRVVCTVHLPITLIRLWQNETGRKRLILDHFMDLVSAVRIANMKVTTTAQVEAYNRHIFRYVSQICNLYPDQHLKPTHHLALHIGDFLEFMGPTHSHNSPFFERYINFFHHRNTNSHPGELDGTLLESSAIHSNVRGLLEDEDEIRSLVCEMVERMDKIDKEDIRGFRLASILDPSLPSSTLDGKGTPATLSSLHERLWRDHLASQGHSLPENIPRMTVNTHKQIAIRGVRYSTTNHIFRDSTIMFSEELRAPDSSLPIVHENSKAAFIDMIFQIKKSSIWNQPNGAQRDSELASPAPEQYFLLIRELIPAQSLQNSDPFKRYGTSGGFLCRNDEEILRIISLDQVTSHATLTEMSVDGFGKVYHVLCVDRLMNNFTTFDFDYNVDDLTSDDLENSAQL